MPFSVRKVAGVRLVLKGNPGYAHAIDLLDELQRIKAAGKKVVCYAEVLSQNDLMFASAADLLVVPPSGMVILEGLQAELFYLKDLLDKIDLLGRDLDEFSLDTVKMFHTDARKSGFAL